MVASRAGPSSAWARDTEVRVVVDDAGEVGLLQTGLHAMAAGLGERERPCDLFGRHVGTDVAVLALEHGVELGRGTRTVAALFVDVTGSTASAQELGPEQVVALLNRFFEIVVDATSAEGGPVDEFEGDRAVRLRCPPHAGRRRRVGPAGGRAITDAVNEAARLTDLAEDHPGRVVASDAAVQAADVGERPCWQRAADVVLRGRSSATGTWVRRR